MPDPITTDDLYGPSNPPTPEGKPEVTAGGLPIEETPEIPMATPPQTTVPSETHSPPPVQHPKNSPFRFVGIVILFIGLFGLGIWLSSFIRQYLPIGLTQEEEQEEEVFESVATPTPTDPYASWGTYEVVSGTDKKPIAGVSIRLPADVLPPICDTVSCLSQGTYLPGGTRLTIAPRGAGQLLADFRGSAITDANGTVFTTTTTTVQGKSAITYSGNFQGRTVGGYGFTQMRGVMIEVTPTLSLELNHFAPTGVTTDFTADDTLFDTILETLVLPLGTAITPEVTLPSTVSTLPATQ